MSSGGLLGLDRELFLFLNTELVCGFCDHFFVIITTKWFGILSGCIFALIAILFYKKEGFYTFVIAVVGVVLVDRIICDVLKPLIGRQRPPWTLDGVRVLVGVTRACSFPSAHAGNHFTFFSILFFRHRKLAWYYLPLALFISYSRIYVGVHYPLDIIGGAVFGVGSGFLIVWSFNLIREWFTRKKQTNAQ
jgi:undecaprenyl-diphosphatase